MSVLFQLIIWSVHHQKMGKKNNPVQFLAANDDIIKTLILLMNNRKPETEKQQILKI